MITIVGTIFGLRTLHANRKLERDMRTFVRMSELLKTHNIEA